MKTIDSCFSGVYLENNIIFFFDNVVQALCQMDLNTGEVKELVKYMGDDRLEVAQIFKYQKSFYIPDTISSKIIKYVINENRLYEFKKEEEDSAIKTVFDLQDFFMLVENKLWCFNRFFVRETYYFDLVTEEYCIDDVMAQYILQGTVDNSMFTVYSGGYGENYWRVRYNTNILEKYDLEKRKIEELIVDANIKLSAVCFDGENIWLTEADTGRIICANQSGECVWFFEDSECFNELSFSKLMNLKEYIVALPRMGDYILFITKKSKEIHKINFKESGINCIPARFHSSRIMHCFETKEYVFFSPWGLDSFFKVSKSEWQIEKMDILYMEKRRTFIKQNKGIVPCLCEDGTMHLEQFIKYFIRSNVDMSQEGKQEEVLGGRKIFKSLI